MYSNYLNGVLYDFRYSDLFYSETLSDSVFSVVHHPKERLYYFDVLNIKPLII